MQRNINQCDLSIMATVRGDVATLEAVAVGDHEATIGPAMLSELMHNMGKSQKQEWGRDAYYRVGDLLFMHADELDEMAQRLEIHGHYIEIIHSMDWPLLQSALPACELPGVSSYEWRLVEEARQHVQGQLVVPAGNIPGAISGLVRIFFDQNILVVAKSSKEVKRIAHELRQRTERQVSTGQTVPRDMQPLVHVDVLSRLCRTAHDWGVLIFADVESARAVTGMQQAASMPDSLIYAVRATEQRLDWEDLLRLRVTFGPVIYHFDQGAHLNTDVIVLTIRAARHRGFLPSCPVKRKARATWNNPKRNEQAAYIATAFADRNWGDLQRCHIPVDQIEVQLDKIGEQPRVAILVESPQHARELRRLLPGWRLAKGTALADKHAPAFPLDAQKLIVTRVRAKAAGVAADVIIRADGNDTQWSDDYGPHWGFDRPAMLVVDLQDRFDAGARRYARERVEDYQQRGWAVLAATPRTAVTIA